MVILSKSISQWWASSNLDSKYWISSLLSSSGLRSRFTVSTFFRSARLAFFAPASSSGGNSNSFSPLSIRLSISKTCLASSIEILSEFANFSAVIDILPSYQNFVYWELARISWVKWGSKTPPLLFRSCLGIVDTTLFSGLDNLAAVHKGLEQVRHPLSRHLILMLGIEICHNRKLLEQFGDGVSPAGCHLLINPLHHLGVLNLLCSILLFAGLLGNRSKQGFQLLTNIRRKDDVLIGQDGVQSLSVGNLLFHNYQFLSGGRSLPLFVLCSSLGTIILYHKPCDLSIP